MALKLTYILHRKPSVVSSRSKQHPPCMALVALNSGRYILIIFLYEKSLHMYVCTYVLTYVCVRVYVRMYICMYMYTSMYVCLHVNVLGDDGPFKITIYHVTSLQPGKKALTTTRVQTLAHTSSSEEEMWR